METTNFLPEHIKQGDLQYEDIIDGKEIKIFYDDKATAKSNYNEYAMFADGKFIAWLPITFTEADVLETLKKYSPIEYDINLYRGV